MREPKGRGVKFENWELTNDCIENHGSGCIHQSAELRYDGHIKKYGTAVIQHGEIDEIIDVEQV